MLENLGLIGFNQSKYNSEISNEAKFIIKKINPFRRKYFDISYICNRSVCRIFDITREMLRKIDMYCGASHSRSKMLKAEFAIISIFFENLHAAKLNSQ